MVVRFFCLLALLIPGNIYAGNLYLDSVEKSVVTEKELNEARKSLKELKEVKLIENLPLKPYHKRLKTPEPLRESFCFTCHKRLPHGKNDHNRTFLNMHTGFIACEVCHFKAEGTPLEYVTEKEEGANQHDGNASGEKPAVKKMIIPYFKGEAVTLPGDHPYAKEVEKKWKKLPPEEKARLKAKLHKPLKDKGPLCRDCHSKKQKILNFKALGYKAKRIKALEQNKIADFLDKVKDKKKSIKITDLLDKK
ncbi:MAG: hypothetical protein IME96_03185 [Proteobacteria bacterium]|nr:hypothetical protein [Pseudomonadota bacterium]